MYKKMGVAAGPSGENNFQLSHSLVYECSVEPGGRLETGSEGRKGGKREALLEKQI